MIKPKIKTTKLTFNPLFINFLNWERDKQSIINILEDIKSNFTDDGQKAIVQYKIEHLSDEHLLSLDKFQEEFKKYIDNLISQIAISEEFLYWLNNAFKYVEDKSGKIDNGEQHLLTIKDPDGRWLEGIICFNFIFVYNYFGWNIIKKCPICSKYFCHKGKYAKYCSEACKESGKKANNK